MKKSYILILFLTIFFSSMICLGQIKKSHAVEEASVDELQSLFASFYNNGVYVKDTEIYVNDNVKNEISYFHAKVNDLERTTYYNGNELWFSTGSGYGTNGENLTHFTVENGVKGTETVHSDLPGMEAYYCTLNDFVEGVHNSAHSNNVDLNLEKGWTLNDGVYSSSAFDVLDAFRLFTAPLWLGKTAENANYIGFTKATVEVVGNSLVMKLWIDSTDAEGKLVLDAETDGANAVFSKAVIQPLSIWDGGSVSESLDEVDGKLLIQSAADLAYVRASKDTFSGKTLQMTTSVYMKEANYMIEKMDGTFDGDGYSVRGLNISNTVANTGFVRVLASTGTVENLSVYGKVQGADISSSYTAGIVGKSSGKIINCHNYATVSAGTSKSTFVGGIVGSNDKTTGAGAHIINCTNNANVTANKQVGGIIGTLYLASNVISCTNTGDINSKGIDTGGIIGSLGGTSASIVKECVNNGNVTGTKVGGIVGVSYTKNNSIICCCVNTGVITGTVKGDILGVKTTQANSTDFVYVTHEWELVEENGNIHTYKCPCGEEKEEVIEIEVEVTSVEAINIDQCIVGETTVAHEILVLQNGVESTKNITYSSSNEAIATVDDTNVTITGEGTATISVLYDGLPVHSFEVTATNVWYPIYTTTDFLNARSDGSKNYKLMNDIDFKDAEIESGPRGVYYAGTIDGQGYTVKNFTLVKLSTASDVCFSLFGGLDGTIKNLNIVGVKTSHYGGVIAEYVRYGTIDNCLVEVTINSMAYVNGVLQNLNTNANSGAFAYRLNNAAATLKNSISVITIEITEAEHVALLEKWYGAFVGRNSGTIDNCQAIVLSNHTLKPTTSTSSNKEPNANCVVYNSIEDFYKGVNQSQYSGWVFDENKEALPYVGVAK